MDQHIKSEVDRFHSVMAKRETSQAFIELLGKLIQSKKFSEEAKPYCIGRFFQAAAGIFPDVQFEDGFDYDALLSEIKDTGAGKLLIEGLTPGEVGEFVGALVARLFFTETLEAEPIHRLFLRIIDCGLVPHATMGKDAAALTMYVLVYLSEAGEKYPKHFLGRFNSGDIDLLCDLNWVATCRNLGRSVPAIISEAIADYEGKGLTLCQLANF